MGYHNLDTFQVAEVLGVSPATVRRLAHEGELTKIGAARPDGARFGRPRSIYDLDEVLALASRRKRGEKVQFVEDDATRTEVTPTYA